MESKKNLYSEFVYSTNIEGSGKASSYVKALDLLSRMLSISAFGFEDCIDIWCLNSVDRLDQLRDLVSREQNRGTQSVWLKDSIPKSYLTKGYCKAALSDYRRFLVEQGYEKALMAKFVEHDGSGSVVSKDLQLQIDLIDIGEGKDVVTQAKTRLNQNVFRKMILNIYNNTCCITGLNIPEVNRASHIISWADDKDKRLDPSNGLCLSATYDAAFDRHLISVDDDYRLILSKTIRDHYTSNSANEYFVSKEGMQITLPNAHVPDRKYLASHRERGEF